MTSDPGSLRIKETRSTERETRLSGRFMTVYVRGREGPLLCVTVGRPEGSSRPPRLCGPAVVGGLAGRPRRGPGRTPSARRSRDCVGGSMALAARNFWLCVSTCVYGRRTRPALGATPPSHAARPRRRRLCAAQWTPHRRRRAPARQKGGTQRILTQRAPKYNLPCRQLISVRLCHCRERPAPASFLHRRVHRRHSSSQRPKGQPPVAGTAALVARNR